LPKEHYIVGLDIGTQNLRVVQAKIDEATGALSVIGASSVPSAGMRKGVIVDIEEAVSSVSAVLEKVERMTGVPVTHANISVGGNHITCIESKGVIAVSRADGEISENDVIRVIDASQAISIPPNREVIHVIPKTFTLDGQTGIKDPVGMTGIRLEVETIIIHGALPFLKNLNKAILQTGLEVDQLVLNPLAAGTAVLNKRQKELGVALIDLGAGTTSLAVYEENNLLHTAIIPVGSMHITNDIAIGLRCTIETAEKIKLMYGSAGVDQIDKHQVIDMSKIDPEEQERVSRLDVVEIMEARLEEIFDLVNRELKKIGRDGKLPAGIVLTGGGSELPGITEFAKRRNRGPAAGNADRY
jgi:cell division protein FtsA